MSLLARLPSPLRIRDYRWLLTGLFFYFMAMQMSGVARAYLAYDLTGRASALGLVALAWGMPMLVLSPLGGVVADRVEKRTILLITQSSIFAMYVLLALLVYSGLIELWHLVVVSLFQGSFFAFNMPARHALIPEVVGPKGDLQGAVALGTATVNVNRVLAPALAGTLIALPFFGMKGIFFIVAACDFMALISLARIKPTGVVHRVHPPIIHDMKLGADYILRHRALVPLMSMAFLVIILGLSYQSMLVVFARDKVFDVGAFGFGLMNATIGVGAICGSLSMVSLGGFAHRSTLQLALAVTFGVGLVTFGLMPNYLLALPVLALLGLISSSYTTLNNTLILAHTTREFTGRVMSVYLLTWSLQPLAIMPLTALADGVGVRAVVAGIGAALAVLATAVTLAFPGYRKLGRPETIAAAHAESMALAPPKAQPEQVPLSE